MPGEHSRRLHGDHAQPDGLAVAHQSHHAVSSPQDATVEKVAQCSADAAVASTATVDHTGAPAPMDSGWAATHSEHGRMITWLSIEI